jgi:hypothetical protein
MLITCKFSLASDNHAQVKVTIKVEDENGKSVEGTRVGIGFTEYLHWSSKEIPVIGFTGGDGLFSASAKADGYLGFNVTKDGYYKSTGNYRFKDIKNGNWEPWNPEITVVLRKKENPVPMYARDTLITKITIPVANKDVGFDLIEFDWVAPNGKGQNADIFFKLYGTYVDGNNYDMKLDVNFPREFDGIQTLRQDIRQGSILKLLRFAPESGYVKEISKYRIRNPKKAIQDNFDDINNYYFRVRSEEKDHKLVRAMYGKVHGDIKFFPKSQSTATIVFRYYLNPDYTRNMEFSRNLFKGLNVGID